MLRTHGARARRRHFLHRAVLSSRLARRITRRILAELLDDSTSKPPALEVGTDARWFRRAGEPAVDLSRRRSLRLLVERFTRLRVESPGQPLSLDELFQSGWPGERASAAAAHRRVYTAIGQLRDLGLRNMLVRRDGGYLLSPEVPVVRSPAEAREPRAL